MMQTDGDSQAIGKRRAGSRAGRHVRRLKERERKHLPSAAVSVVTVRRGERGGGSRRRRAAGVGAECCIGVSLERRMVTKASAL